MPRRFHNFFCLLISVLVVVLLSPSLKVLAQDGSDTRVYFPETGHTVQAPFLDFFKATGGLTRYGYPITDDYADPQTKLLVQYFQKARLEWHPDNPDPYKIQLGLLGDELNKRMPGIPVKNIPAPSDPSCTYFIETGHTVCYQFLDYWRQAGGLDMFGYPITEYMIEDGMIVQYFQRAKMEWQPSKPAGQRIQLAALGELYYHQAGLPESQLQPTQPGGIVDVKTTTSVQAHASALNGSAPRGGLQAAYVRVVDQLNRPLSDAAVTLIIHYPQGDKSLLLSPTDSQGVTMQTFDAGNAAPGTIISLEFIISYPGLAPVQAPTSYMIWYY